MFIAIVCGRQRREVKASYDTALAIVSLHRSQVRAAHWRAASHESRTTVKHRSATAAGLDLSSSTLAAVAVAPSSAEASADQDAADGFWRASLVTLVMIQSNTLPFFIVTPIANKTNETNNHNRVTGADHLLDTREND